MPPGRPHLHRPPARQFLAGRRRRFGKGPHLPAGGRPRRSMASPKKPLFKPGRADAAYRALLAFKQVARRAGDLRSKAARLTRKLPWPAPPGNPPHLARRNGASCARSKRSITTPSTHRPKIADQARPWPPLFLPAAGRMIRSRGNALRCRKPCPTSRQRSDHRRPAAPTWRSPLPLLPGKAEQRAMSIFYAFCRVVDDVADSTDLTLGRKTPPARPCGARKSAAPTSASRVTPARPRDGPDHPHLPHRSQRRWRKSSTAWRWTSPSPAIPNFALLRAVLLSRGQRGRLGQHRHLRLPRAAHVRDYAVALGMAFQLTNILRDVKKDASFGRIYLPLDELGPSSA